MRFILKIHFQIIFVEDYYALLIFNYLLKFSSGDKILNFSDSSYRILVGQCQAKQQSAH